MRRGQMMTLGMVGLWSVMLIGCQPSAEEMATMFKQPISITDHQPPCRKRKRLRPPNDEVKWKDPAVGLLFGGILARRWIPLLQVIGKTGLDFGSQQPELRGLACLAAGLRARRAS